MLRKVAAYSASVYAATVVSSGVAFVATLFVARRIPKDALGLYGLYVTVYSFLSVLTIAGVNQAVVKFLGDAKTDRREMAAIVLALVAAIAAVAWTLAAAAALAGARILPWSFAAFPFAAQQVLVGSLFRADFARGREMALTLSISLLNSALTVLFVVAGVDGLPPPIAGDLLSLVLPGGVVAIFLARRGGVAAPRELVAALRGGVCRRLLAFAVPLSIAGVAFTTYHHASAILLRLFAGLAALGELTFALGLMQILEKPLQIVARVFLASLAQEPFLTAREHRKLVSFNVTLFPLLAASVAAFAPHLLALADRILGFAGGDALSRKYESAALFLALFAAAVPLRSVELLVSGLAIARGRGDVHRDTHVTAACLSLPLLAVSIALFGAVGAAAMPLVYQAIFFATLRRRFRASAPEIVSNATRAAVGATFLIAGLLASGRLPGGAWIFPVGAAAYVAAGPLLGLWNLGGWWTRNPPADRPVRSTSAAPPAP